MHQTRTLPTTASPLVLVVLLWGLLWGVGAQQVTPLESGDASDVSARVLGSTADDVWRSTWSQRFPGCVALPLWPQDEHPRAVLTRTPGGDMTRVAPERLPRAAAATRVVGVCR